MAKDPSSVTIVTDASDERIPLPFSGKTVAYLLLRVLVGMLLLLAGVDKFKSPEAPYNYSFSYWHDEKDPQSGEVVKNGRWLSVGKTVYEHGGFNNADLFQFGTFMDKQVLNEQTGTAETLKGGVRITNFLSYIFSYYAQALPYLMLVSGGMILLGLFNRLGLFLGGFIWISLVIGQATLPDNQYISLLSNYVLMVALAAATLKYNRFAITRF
ncbi:MAG: DoxX family rane protein [Verrucomicrobiales bacterium]|nr:DoxX family rane protein [Verrucomicrobiales bacterium]